ncbi:hypothetical protein [Spirosoma linguale]|uniref:Uncharacterized protein n=1 Tax=Spirosoma linguale (strain ATCC 33905 / DSM 74 / LMG 10896 / Claus 1) TaxID=504472 RepID=D2QS09_SPILD|nr:hypothetical protein Slin_5626 [Spirosoma linguale DSM 74]
MASLRLFLTPKTGYFVLLTGLIIGIELAVTHTAGFNRHPVAVSLGVVFDLVFVTTGLFYWLVAKPLRLPRSRSILIAVLMLRLASFILPKGDFLPNQFWPVLLILTEVMVLILAGLRIRTIVQTYRRLRPHADKETALQGSLAAVFGHKVAAIIMGEGLTLYYVLMGWRLTQDVLPGSTALTTHRQSGQIALVVSLLIVGLIETVGVHVLLNRWNPSVAFWVTLTSVYGLLFFIADMIATVKRPSYLTDTHLHLRLGVRWRAIVPRSAIANVRRIHEKPVKQSGQLNGAFLTAPTILLTFSEPICFDGPYGLKKQISQFSFCVDNPDSFVQLLRERA